MVLVIIILVAWAVILGPGFIKRRAHSGGDQSITSFHQQLRILEHSAPEPIVAPAYRLRSVDGAGSPTGITYPDTGKPPVLTVVGAKELPRPALAFLGEPVPDEVTRVDESGQTTPDNAPRAVRIDRSIAQIDTGPDYDEEWDSGAPSFSDPPGFRAEGLGPRGIDAMAREVARRRRRDTLSVLVVVFVASLLFGVVSGATAVWAVCALDAVALAAYVAVLVHLRRMAVERERKLHYLEPNAGTRPVRAGGPPTYVSGRYAHPSNQRAAAH